MCLAVPSWVVGSGLVEVRHVPVAAAAAVATIVQVVFVRATFLPARWRSPMAWLRVGFDCHG